jgi:hypothetical protein
MHRDRLAGPPVGAGARCRESPSARATIHEADRRGRRGVEAVRQWDDRTGLAGDAPAASVSVILDADEVERDAVVIVERRGVHVAHDDQADTVA